MSKKTSAQRRRLWRRNHRCHWCNRVTHLVNTGKPGQTDPLFATIDHVRSRLDPRRSEPANGEVRHVLACFECNQKRARFEMTEEYADEFRRRSNSDESLLHLPYPERSRRLKILAKRIEDSGLSGLVSVMGVPARWEMGRLPVKAGI